MKGLNRIELVVGGIIVMIFLIWSYDTCSSSNEKYKPQVPTEQEPATQADNNDNANNNSNSNATNNPTPQVQPTPAPPVQVAPTYITVYVSTERLNMRDKPFLSGSKVVAELFKGAELFYLNNKTEYRNKITIDNIPYDEPWLEVQTKEGKKGWIYAGGVRFYK